MKLEVNTSDNALKLGYNLADITQKLYQFIQSIETENINPHRKLKPSELARPTILTQTDKTIKKANPTRLKRKNH